VVLLVNFDESALHLYGFEMRFKVKYSEPTFILTGPEIPHDFAIYLLNYCDFSEATYLVASPAQKF